MIFDYNLYKRARTGEAGRKSLLPLSAKFVALSEKSRRDGLLSLEEDMSELPDSLMKDALRLVIDGTDSSQLEQLMLSTVYASSHRGRQLLEDMLVCTGVLAIQQGHSPLMVEMMLSPFVGRQPAKPEAWIHE